MPLETKPDQIPFFTTSVPLRKLKHSRLWWVFRSWSWQPRTVQFSALLLLYIKIVASSIIRNGWHVLLFSAETCASQCKLRRLRAYTRLSALPYNNVCVFSVRSRAVKPSRRGSWCVSRRTRWKTLTRPCARASRSQRSRRLATTNHVSRGRRRHGQRLVVCSIQIWCNGHV